MSISQILAASMGADSTLTEEAVAGYSLESIEEAGALACESEVEMINIESAIEIAGNTVAGLEALIDHVGTMREQGGLDANGAALLAIAAGTAMAPFGGQLTQPLPAMESFEGDGGRAIQTDYAMEGLVDTLKGVWESIMKMIKRAKDAMAKFIDEHLSNVGRMRKAAEALIVKAEKAEGSPKESKLKGVSRVQYLMAGNKMLTNIPGDMKKLAIFVKQAAYNKAAIAAGNKVTADLEGYDLSKAKVADIETDLKMALSSYRADISKAYGFTDGDMGNEEVKKEIGKMKGATLDLGLGNGFLVSKQDAETVAINIVAVMPPEPKKDTEVDALSASEAADYAKGVVTLCDAILDTKNAARSGDKLDSGVEKAGKKMVSAVSKEATSEEARILRSLLNSLGSVSKNQRTADTSILKYASSVAAAGHSLAVRSVKNIKKNDK